MENEERKQIFTKQRIIIGGIALLLLLILGYFLFFRGGSVKVERIELAQTNVSLKPGETFMLRAYVSPTNASNKVLQYATTDSTIATVSNSGLITAIKEGNTQIIVKSADGNKQSICTLTVGQTVEELVVNTSEVNLTQGSNQKIEVTVTPPTSQVPPLTYTSSDPKIATVDETGKVIAVSAGTVTITITGNNGTGTPLTKQVKVTVTKSSSNNGGNTNPTPDKTAPTCTLKLDGSNVIVTGKDKSGLATSPYSWDNKATWTKTTTKADKAAGSVAFTYKVYVKDKAGNVGSCSFSCTVYTKTSDNVDSCTATGSVGIGTSYTTCSNGYQYRYTLSYFCNGKYDDMDDVSGTYSSNYYYASSTNALNACNTYTPSSCNSGLTNPPSRSCSTQSKVTYHIQKTYTRTCG